MFEGKESLVSVIVPVYNVEKYLSTCIESIINQTYDKLEIILVDDGSQDKSSEICDNYANKDKRITAVHTKNRGLSEARNTGLRIAKGEYISFIDSDDFIKLDSYENLLNSALKYEPDVIVGEAYKYFNDGKSFPKMKEKNFSKRLMSGSEFLKESLLQERYTPCVPFNIYKRNLIIDNNLFFKKGILHEDQNWTPQIFLKTQKLYFSDIFFYFHRWREGSIMASKGDKSKNGVDLVNTCYELSNIFENLEDCELKKLLNDYLVNMFLSGISVGKLHRKKYESLIDKDFVNNKAIRRSNIVRSKIFTFNILIFVYLNRLFSLDIFSNFRKKIKECIDVSH